MDNIEEKKTKRKKLFLYLGMGLSVASIAATCVGIYCSGRRDERLKLSTKYSEDLKEVMKYKDREILLSYDKGFDKGIQMGKEDVVSQSSDAYKRGFSDGLNSSDSVTSKMLQDAYNEGEFHEKYRLLDELSTPDLSVPEQRYLAGCCDIKLVKMRDGEGEMMLSNHTNPRAENSIAMMKELRRNSL